jgi:hypothetical protein
MSNDFLECDLASSYPVIAVKTNHCKLAPGVVAHVSVEEVYEGKFKVSIALSQDLENEVERIELDSLATPINLCVYEALIPFGYACYSNYRENAVESMLGKGSLRAERYGDEIRISLDHIGFSGRKDVSAVSLRKYITVDN